MKASFRSEITVAQVFEAYYDCRRRKRNTAAAQTFEIDLEANLMQLYEELQSGAWSPSPASVFAIKYPKPREVWAAQFRDRIVHHLLYAEIGPIFERAFIHDSCASIKGRGTLYAADRLNDHLRSATENWTRKTFYLKADIRSFFGSIRQDALFTILARRVRDNTMLDLCRKLVFQDIRRDAVVQCSSRDLALVPRHKSLFHAPAGVGLPIGNLSSQFFANALLDPLDQAIKRRLGMRHYVRYVDDMVIIHESPAVLLDAANAIRAHLAGIGMQLAESKTFVAPVDQGVDFVGHILRPHRRSGRAKTHRNALRRVMAAPIDEVAVCCNSYLGLYRHVGSLAQREAICRVGAMRGLRFDQALTKVIWKEPIHG
ncbi:RNA-directed DNA polymerase [Telmatospirillum sp.]|uniref:RNA-directed DNA polymerase n=1 Tax=Telmatospirillum sp. TaxID=2079197 RepID=UPI00284E5779|nr:RNA-directed DNA polymerase [Telmatospirillum sp.]MDR3438994.1 RNA-directed DNA polymerase [Telmatospirillum sp.]